MSKENLKDTMGSLFDGMEGFLTSKNGRRRTNLHQRYDHLTIS